MNPVDIKEIDLKEGDIEIINLKDNAKKESKLNSQMIPHNKRKSNIFEINEDIEIGTKFQLINIEDIKEEDVKDQNNTNYNYVENNISVKE